MKPQKEGFIEKIYTTLLGFALAAVFLVVIFLARDVLFPILRFIAKSAMKGLRKLFTKGSAKAAAPAVELPTPEIFKGATNLAPAKQLRF